MLFHFFAFANLFFVGQAKEIFVVVGDSTPGDAGAVFRPPSVFAARGDVVVFNFTQGNHTAIQALFASPCIPAHEVDSTVNGFNSGFRAAGNFSAITFLRVPIDNQNDTHWFYDQTTCADGGVGGININETGWETLDGFVRNAIRLNGSEATSAPTTSGPSSSTTAFATGGLATQIAGADSLFQPGVAIVVPLLAVGLAALSLSL